MITVREDGTGHIPVGGLLLGSYPVGQCAFRRARRVGIERGVVAEQRRAIGTDDFGSVAHIEIYMRVIERRQLALAHEFPRADLDDRDAWRIVEMRNDPLGHVFVPH